MPTMPPTFRPAGRPTVQERRRDHDARRPSPSKRGYDAAWRRLRHVKLQVDSLCEICLREDRLESAAVVDHIQPHRGDDALRLDMDNLQSLCASCHSRKTVRYDGGFGRPARANGRGGAD